MTSHDTLSRLSDEALLAETARLATRERRATAGLIAALTEVDARRLYLAEGCSSLYTYCTRVLRLSEHAAYGQIMAARTCRQYPVALEMLSAGSLTLTNICLVAPHLTPENHPEVLAEACHKSRREVEQQVAALQALKGVTRLCRLELMVTVETLDRLRRAQDLLRHTIPDGDPAAVVDKALAVLITQLEKQKLAATDRPSRDRPAHPRSRHIPASVRRAVWKRDGGQCAFVGSGGRCEERGFLEFHHIQPYAAGGKATVENVQLRCRAHNAYEADLFFGNPMLVRERRVIYAVDPTRFEPR
jgi:hypothetical protein